MTRHGQNATANSVYSYHERKKDQAQSGYGSLEQRLSKDAVKGFDCCSLTLQPCQDPVVTSQGHIFDKKAILEYMVAKRKENAQRLKDWEKEQEELKLEEYQQSQSEKEKAIRKFVTQEATPTVHSFLEDGLEPGTSKGSSSSVKRKQNPSFWVPSEQPNAKKTKLEKPVQKVYCPVSGEPLKLKDLTPITFTPMPDEDKRNAIAKDVRYMCAITHDALTNTTAAAVLKPSGRVVTLEAINTIVKKDWMDPFTSEKITEADIIILDRGGTGFAATNEKLKAKLARPVLEIC